MATSKGSAVKQALQEKKLLAAEKKAQSNAVRAAEMNQRAEAASNAVSNLNRAIQVNSGNGTGLTPNTMSRSIASTANDKLLALAMARADRERAERKAAAAKNPVSLVDAINNAAKISDFSRTMNSAYNVNADKAAGLKWKLDNIVDQQNKQDSLQRSLDLVARKKFGSDEDRALIRQLNNYNRAGNAEGISADVGTPVQRFERDFSRETMPKQDVAKYQEYKRAANALEMQRSMEEARNLAERNPLAGAAISTYGNMLGAALTPVGAVGSKIGGEQNIDINAPIYRMTRQAQAAREGTQQGVKNALNISDFDENGNRTWQSRVADFGTGTALSMLDTIVRSTFAGPLAGGLEAGLAAGSQGFIEAKEKGFDDAHALASGAAQGIAEELFETISLEGLQSMKGKPVDGLRTFLVNVGKQSVTEGSEEFFTDWASALSDYMINGGNSEWARSYNHYKSLGMSDRQAMAKTAQETLQQSLLSFLGGAVSGAFLGGGTQIVEGGINRQTGNALLNEGQRYTADVLSDAANSIDISEQAFTDNRGNVDREALQNAKDSKEYLEELAKRAVERKLTPSETGAAYNAQIGVIENAINSGAEIEENEEITRRDQERMAEENEEDRKALRLFEEAEQVRLPEDVRENMVNSYNGMINGSNGHAYMQAYKRAYVGGYNDVDINAVQRSPLVSTYLTQDQLMQAYKDGIRKSGIPNNIQFTKGPARKGGITYADENATKSQKKIAQWAGNKTGFSVEIRSDIKGGAEIDTKAGVLRINPNSKNFNQSLAHELTHLIRTYDNEGYKTYQKLVVDALMNSREQSYDALYAQYEEAYGKTGTTPNVDDVIEEMVADGAGQFLNDEEFINKIVHEDRSLAEKIVDFFRGIVDALKETMSQEGLSRTSKALRENYATYQAALDAWSKALTNASENYQSGLTVESTESIRNQNQLEYAHPELANDTGIYKGQDLVSKDYSRYSMFTFDETGRKNLSEQLKKEVSEGRMSKKNADKIKDQMEWAYDMVQKYSNTGEYPMFSAWQTAEYKLKDDGTPVFSVVVPNGDYELNLDFTTVCKKRDTLDQVLTALARNGDLNYKKLNQKQLARINEIIKANGFEIACSTCFVDSKRYNISNWAHSLTDGTKSRNGFNQAIASMLNDKVGASYFNYVTNATTYDGKPTFTPGQKLLSELSTKELLALNPHAFDYINERLEKLSPKSYEYRMLKAIKESRNLRSFLNPNDFISSIGQDIIQEQNPALDALLQSLGGSSRPKPSHGRVAYYSEIINNHAFTPEAAYKAGGVRVQSFSDYMANMVFDYMQMIGDMAAKRLPSHAYTKEAAFAKLYGLTGMKINMSIMPKAIDWNNILDLDGMNIPQQAVKISDFKKTLTKKQISQLKKYAGLRMELTENGDFVPVTDENGKYIPIVDDETFPMEEALAIRSAEGYKENCGTIWIGTSDEQIRTLLRMEEADMVIPYHASSLNPAVKEMRNIEYLHDYTLQQRTRQKSGDRWKAIPANKEFDFYESLMRTKDGRATANEYLAWCDEHGYKPKFDQFRNEENYYKLLEDFRLYDGDTSVMQHAVETNFPGEDSAFGSFESLMRENLDEANATANSLGQKLPSIVQQIRDEFGITDTTQLRHQLDIDDNGTGFESDVVFNDNQDIISASETLGKILSGIDEMPSKKAISDTAVKIRRATGTNVGLEKIKNDLNSLYSFLAYSNNIDGADISHLAADLAGEMIRNSDAKISSVDKEIYDEFRKKISSYTFHMPAGFEGEVQKLGGVGALRKEFFGTLNITNEKGSTIDQVWEELCELYPEYFSKDITNPADQLEQIVEITRSLKPNPEVEAMSDEDFDIYRYTIGQDILKAFVENGKNVQMREQYEQKLAKGLQKAKEKVQTQKEKARLRKLDREARSNLLKKAQRLSKMKGGPEFEQAKQDLIGDLDLIAKGIRNDTRAKLEALEQHATDLAARDENYKLLYYDNAKAVFDRLKKTRINDMSGQEVQDLTDKIVELMYQEQAYKRMLNEQHGIMAATVARRGIAQQAYAKGINERNMLGSFIGRLRLNMLNPTRAMQFIDGYQNAGVFTELGKELNDGQTKMNTFVMNASKKFNGFLDEHPELVKEWSKADINIGTKDNPVYISKGMRISLYLHSLNQQNRNHIANAGIKIPDANLYNKGKYEAAYRYGKTVKLQPTDLKAIAAQMTEDEKAFAKLAHEFLNKDTKDAINETSLMLTGTYKAIVDNYFPIRTDPNFTKRDISGLVTDGTIEGMGMLKERIKGATVPVLMEDVAQVLQRQTNNTGRYFGLAIPVRDFNKILNFTESGLVTSTKNAINQTWGKPGLKYIEDMLNNIQAGAPADNGPGAEIFNTLKGTYASTVLNWNLGVAMKQSASAPFAATVLDAKSVARAMTKDFFTKADYDYMDSITPWSYMRRQGMSGTEMGEVYKQKNAVESSKAWQKIKQKLNWIQAVDVWTTDRLFFATEYYVREHYPDLEVRGEAYNKKVAEIYNDMLQRTQPGYEVMQRNAYLRSGNALAKVAGMFKTQTFNMGGEILDAYGKMEASRRMLKDGRISEAQAKQAKAQFGKTIAATATSQMMLTALAILAKAAMHTMKNYRDDKGEVTPESIAARGIYDFLTSFAGMMIGGSELQSFGLAVSGKEQWYDLEYPGLAVINDLLQSSVNMSTAFRKALDSGWQAKEVDAFKKSAIKFAMNAAIAGRIPANNIYNLGNAINLWVQDIKNGKAGTFDAGDSLFGIKDSGITKEQYAKQAIKAYAEGDTAKAEYAMQNTNKEKIEAALGAESEKNDNGTTVKNSLRVDALRKIDEMDMSTADKVQLAINTYGLEGVTEDNWSECLDIIDAKVHGNQDGVIEYLNNSGLSEEEQRNLWENVCGYSPKTFDSKVANTKETEQETESVAEPQPEPEPEPAPLPKVNDKAENIKAASKAAAEIDKELAESSIEYDARYAYVVDQVTSKKRTAQEAVDWYLSDSSRASSAKYLSWKNAGGSDYDYLKTRADLTRFKGNGKQEKIANYIKKQNMSEEKQRAVWFDICEYSQKNWNKYF